MKEIVPSWLRDNALVRAAEAFHAEKVSKARRAALEQLRATEAEIQALVAPHRRMEAEELRKFEVFRKSLLALEKEHGEGITSRGRERDRLQQLAREHTTALLESADPAIETFEREMYHALDQARAVFQHHEHRGRDL